MKAGGSFGTSVMEACLVEVANDTLKIILYGFHPVSNYVRYEPRAGSLALG